MGRPKLDMEDEMKRRTARKPRDSKRVPHLPKAWHAALRAGETGKTGVSFWWLTKGGELIWDENNQVPGCLQILQLRKHMLPTEIILDPRGIKELRSALDHQGVKGHGKSRG